MIEREKAPDDDDEGSGGDRRECHVAAAALYSQGPNYASIVVVALNGAGALTAMPIHGLSWRLEPLPSPISMIRYRMTHHGGKNLQLT